MSAQGNAPKVDDALPGGLEAVDPSLRTAGLPPAAPQQYPDEERREEDQTTGGWYYGFWEYGWWSPWDHRELRDDRVVYVATTLWPGTYTMTYVARATTPGVFVRPPVHAEEMYNPAVNGRSDGGVFRAPRSMIPPAPTRRPAASRTARGCPSGFRRQALATFTKGPPALHLTCLYR